MKLEQSPMSFEVHINRFIDNETNTMPGGFSYGVIAYFFKDEEKMLMINPETGWSGFSFKSHEELVAFISKCTVIKDATKSIR